MRMMLWGLAMVGGSAISAVLILALGLVIVAVMGG